MTGKSDNVRLSRGIIFSIIIGICFVGYESTAIQGLAKLSIVTLLGLVFILNISFLSKVELNFLRIEKTTFRLFLPLFLLLIVYCFGSVRSMNFMDFYVTLELFLLISFVIFVLNRGHFLIPRKNFLYLVFSFLAINLLAIVSQSSGNLLSPNRLSGLFAQRNSWATISYYLMAFYIIYFHARNRKVRKSGLFLFFLILFMANSRAIYGALIIFYLTYFFWFTITKSKVIYYAYLYSFVILTAIFVSLMIGVFDEVLPGSRLLNLYFQDFTGGNFHSGRHNIWPGIVEQIGKRPFFGYSPGYKPSMFLDTELSAHNFYLQLLLQSGLIGVFLFLWFLTNIWTLFRNNRNVKLVRTTASFIISILFHQMFVVSLTQNNMEQAVLFWLILGLGINSIHTKNRNELNMKWT